ncbi:MAG TPA: hypothetical protein VE397_20680 [Stellaceae bacterium]|jgi:exonuclease VII small subunit|nr:hypothetical protein [Stellaceae bacterium]
MASLDEALKHLERAIERLERASDRIGEQGGAQNGASSEIEADYAALMETTDTVAARLDAAILRIDRALEG